MRTSAIRFAVRVCELTFVDQMHTTKNEFISTEILIYCLLYWDIFSSIINSAV